MKHFFAAKVLPRMVAALWLSCAQPPDAKNKDNYRFIYNNDGAELLGNRWHHFRPLTIEDV